MSKIREKLLLERLNAQIAQIGANQEYAFMMQDLEMPTDEDEATTVAIEEVVEEEAQAETESVTEEEAANG